jgi:hypothetical protein
MILALDADSILGNISIPIGNTADYTPVINDLNPDVGVETTTSAQSAVIYNIQLVANIGNISITFSNKNATANASATSTADYHVETSTSDQFLSTNSGFEMEDEIELNAEELNLPNKPELDDEAQVDIKCHLDEWYFRQDDRFRSEYM